MDLQQWALSHWSRDDAMSRSYYHVVPRYAGGSPAQVDRQLAFRVAEEEKIAYIRHIEGLYGPFAQGTAEKWGLHGIVYASNEKVGKVRLTDLITGRIVDVNFKCWPHDERRWASALYIPLPLRLYLSQSVTAIVEEPQNA